MIPVSHRPSPRSSDLFCLGFFARTATVALVPSLVAGVTVDTITAAAGGVVGLNGQAYTLVAPPADQTVRVVELFSVSLSTNVATTIRPDIVAALKAEHQKRVTGELFVCDDRLERRIVYALRSASV